MNIVPDDEVIEACVKEFVFYAKTDHMMPAHEARAFADELWAKFQQGELQNGSVIQNLRAHKFDAQIMLSALKRSGFVIVRKEE